MKNVHDTVELKFDIDDFKDVNGMSKEIMFRRRSSFAARVDLT